jgi:hypothetical protein
MRSGDDVKFPLGFDSIACMAKLATWVGLLILMVGCDKDKTVSTPAPLAPVVDGPTEASTTAFAPKLAAAMLARTKAIFAADGLRADNVTLTPTSLDVRKTDSLINPVISVITLHETTGGGYQYDFILNLSQRAGHWQYIGGTFQQMPDGPVSAAEANRPWLAQAVEDAQR